MADFYLPAPEPKTELGRYRVLSSTAGIRVSPLCLGGMSIGAAWSGGLGAMTKEDAFALLDAFVEAGGNFIDTANIYQNEESEVWIGEWMKERKNRDQIVVATKYTSQYRAWELGKLHAVNYSGNSKRSMYTSVRDSLQKLQTEWIDILYLHWWDQTTSVNEIMDSLHTLVQQGKVLYLGISNAPAWVVAAANTYATMHGKTPFSVYQGQWNVMFRDLEREIIPMARHFGMALCPWNVMGGGRFQTSKQLEARKTAGEEVRRNSMGAPELTAAEVAMSQALEKVAAEHGIDSITSVAIAYVMAKAPCVYPLVGGRKTSHLEDNIQALSLHLTPKQIEYLESVQTFDLGYPHTLLGPDPKVTGQPTAQLAACSPIAFPKHL